MGDIFFTKCLPLWLVLIDKLLAEVEAVAVLILEILIAVVVLDAVNDLGEDIAGRLRPQPHPGPAA